MCGSSDIGIAQVMIRGGGVGIALPFKMWHPMHPFVDFEGTGVSSGVELKRRA